MSINKTGRKHRESVKVSGNQSHSNPLQLLSIEAAAVHLILNETLLSLIVSESVEIRKEYSHWQTLEMRPA